MKRALLLRLALGLILMSVLPSCGFAFREAWKKVPDTGGVEGKWEGTWLSDATGHTGTLRCVVGKPTRNGIVIGAAGENVGSVPADRIFFYHATWKKILSGSYKAVHIVKKQKDGSYTFKGEHKMPNWAGGLYQYEGTVKGDEFKACYQCSMDKGTYTMKRVR
ncbi:MAG: hypothetical protein K9N47_25665 [Prosthecobacter sp.]|uniref:hypothetical protein n=1 Tax=Prosthecobacter sp. TaxID=1965333 RepID=UPI00261FE378|nr:hypothetical protein [Prosthecobacter sp.]MCF7789537.1 hypothetical protein [Prosthecobacter sp.]